MARQAPASLAAAQRSLARLAGPATRRWRSARARKRAQGPWTVMAEADRGRSYHLSVCAIFKDEAEYLREWVEFHRLMGVDKLFLYDNNSTDASREVLGPYVASGLVTVHDFPPTSSQQLLCYQACLATYGRSARWMAFIDVDEFLYPVEGSSLPEVLGAYEAYPAVAVNWVVFSTSGHIVRPEGLVTRNYTRCQVEGNRHVKLVVDPRRVESFTSSHSAVFADGATAVNERCEPVTGPYSVPPALDRLRINHYFTKSVEDFLVHRPERGQLDPPVGNRDARMLVKGEHIYATGTDTAVQRFLPALEQAMQRADPLPPGP